MRYFLFLLAGFFFSTQQGLAQKQVSVKGVVKTTEGGTLSGASVLLYYPGQKDTLRTVTNDKGAFALSNVENKKVTVMVSFVGYRSFVNQYDYRNQSGEQMIWDIAMSEGDNTLEGITLQTAKVQIKEDTVSYKIDSTMYRKNDNVEELLRKLPGLEVDKAGKVTAQGKEVTRVKVNGKDFFNGDVTTATRELNADMVDKIQVIDDYGDQSAFTGIRDGEASKTLNIQLKKDKNKGYFGSATAGAGTEGRYLGAVSLNVFNNDQQISVIGNINNTNASTFNFSGMNPVMVGMMRTFGRNFGGNNDGVSITKSLGVNFRDELGPKVSVYGSYSLSDKETRTINSSTQQNIYQGRSTTNIQNSNNRSINTNHRLSFNMEYKIDSFNYIKFSPNFSYRNSEGRNYADFSFLKDNSIKTNDGTTATISNSQSPNFSGTLLFNHRFKTKGRTLSINMNGGNSDSRSNDDYENINTYYLPGGTRDSLIYQDIIQDNNNHNFSANASYIEPLNRKQSLEFNYAYSRQVTGNDRETFDVNPNTGESKFSDSLSNIFDNTFITNRIGMNFRTTQKKYNYSIGFAVQPSTIQTNSITGKFQFKRNMVNYFPVIRYAYNFSRSRSLSVTYNGNSNQPSYTQLQPVTDYSNAQYQVVGNPNLKPEFTNRLSMRYNNFDFISGNVFFGNISASYTTDKIVNNVFDLGKNPSSPNFAPGVQQVKYRNTNGYYNVTAFYAYSKPIQNRKYVFNIGGSVNYINNISFVEDEKNKGKNWILSQRFSMDYKLKKWLESTFGANFTLNSNQYSLQKQLSNTSRAWTLSHNSRVFLPKGIIFSYDLDKTINNGFSNFVSANPFIINANIEKQFFKSKKLSLKLQALDMLNENTNVTRTVSGSSIIDSRTNRLGKYYMATAIFRLNKFSGQAKGNSRMMMGMPPPPPMH